MRFWDKGLPRRGLCVAVLCLLTTRFVCAEGSLGVPLDVCADLRMTEVVTHNCTFRENQVVDFTPQEPAWNWLWAHRLSDWGRSIFEASFELDQVRGDLYLTVSHLTASWFENGVQMGYAPISLVVNDTDGDPRNGTNLAIHRDTNEPAEAFDVASHHTSHYMDWGRFGIETDTFVLPARYLRVGTNTVTWASRFEARSSHRVQAFRIYYPSRGRFQFTSEACHVDESGRKAILRVLRQDGWEGTASVHFQVRPITAIGGSDYEDVSGTLTFGHQEQSQTIAIPIRDDSDKEGPETFEVRLLNPDAGCLLGSPAAAIVTIVDDESQPAVLYVDRDAPVDGNGLSWKTAFRDLHDGLRKARQSPGTCQEIWVAEGTYTPDGGSFDQEAGFDLVDGVAVYGGFKGTETRRSQRDLLANPTILSGDLKGDDRPGFTNTSDNAHHVVRAEDVGATAILDGFVIQGGYGTTLYGQYSSAGGGLFLRHASPTIRNCTIQWNRAMDGAGAFCLGLSYPVFEACRFEHNLIDVPMTGGAGMSNRTSSPLLLNCIFLGNRCLGTGGAMCNWDSSPTVLHCTFCWNTAMEWPARGGAFFTFGSAFDTRPVLRNCILASNFANEATQFGFVGTCSLFVEHSIVEDTGSLTWIERDDRPMGLEKGPRVEDRDLQLTPDGHLISNVDALGGLACDLATADIDGDLRPTGQATLGADVCIDSEGDGLPDAWERLYFGGATAAEPNADADGDGISNIDEYRLYGSHPCRTPVYVDGVQGDDSHDGSQTRPKRTIQGALDTARPGDTILLATGTYAGPGNTGIAFQGRQVVLRGMGQTLEATVIDCNHAGIAFRFTDGETPASALANLSITQGRTELGGAVQCHAASPLFVDCRIIDSVCTPYPKALTLQAGQGYDFSKQAVTPTTLGDVYYDHGWFMMDGEHWEIIDMGPQPLMQLGRLAGVWDFECWRIGAWDTDGLKAVAGHSYAIRTWEYERYALVNVLAAEPDRTSIQWLYVNAKSWPGEYRTGGLSVFLSAPRLTGCTIQGSGPEGLYVQNGGLSLVGDLHMLGNELQTEWALLQGPGRLVLDPNTTWHADRVFLRCNVTGPGTIRVRDGSELRIEHQAVVNLSDRGLNGSIVCDGLLLLKDQVLLQDTLIRVNRLSVDDYVQMDNCVVQAEAGAPYGQFFVSGQAFVDIPSIFANGDRYLDVDPRAYDCNNLHVGAIDVVVDEGIGHATGGLFELRGLDLPNVAGEPNVFVYTLNDVPSFSPQTWTINRLELVPGARLNLTNRFDFQAPFGQNGSQEVLFVKELVLGDGAILNTAFNRVYCERLVKADTARIISIPLMGFSLNNIAFDDERDFSTRVKANNIPAADPAGKSILVYRVTGQAPDPNGMMRMRNLSVDGALIYARAQGLFAKASEDTILVRFEYLFESAGGRIAVYLTDSPAMLATGHPDRKDHYSLVGYVDAPPQGRPGSAGSGTFATFEMPATVGGLDFYRGVRIELELIGPDGTSVLINNWDPLVEIKPNPYYCGDLVSPNDSVDAFDFLAVMSESGRRSDDVMSVSGNPIGSCIEGFFCRDGYVTVMDAMETNWHICGLGCEVNDPIGALASLGPSNQAAMYSEKASSDDSALGSACRGASVVMVGKRYSVIPGRSDDFLEEQLYGLDASGASVACADSLGTTQLNVRLVKGQDGELYTVNLDRGLVKLAGDQTVISVGTFPLASEPRYQRRASVYVGVQPREGGVAGLPILDVAFDLSGDVYVVPVVVSPDGNAPYVAAARLSPSSAGPSGPWTVAQLYVPGMQANDNIHLDGLQEIEIDAQGRVYVLNVTRLNQSDTLLVYDVKTGQETARHCLASLGIESPGAMHVSIDSQVLYLSGTGTRLSAASACVFGLPLKALHLQPVDPHEVVPIEILGMGQVTGMTEDQVTGTMWVAGVALQAIPAAFDSTTMLDILNRPPFYSACVASFPRSQQGPVQARPLSGPGCDLVLPLAIEWMGARP